MDLERPSSVGTCGHWEQEHFPRLLCSLSSRLERRPAGRGAAVGQARQVQAGDGIASGCMTAAPPHLASKLLASPAAAASLARPILITQTRPLDRQALLLSTRGCSDAPREHVIHDLDTDRLTRCRRERAKKNISLSLSGCTSSNTTTTRALEFDGVAPAAGTGAVDSQRSALRTKAVPRSPSLPAACLGLGLKEARKKNART